MALLRRLRDADMPEITRLASTIETWWPAIHVALTEHVSNARTESFNRIIKQVKRVGCGFRNMDNYQRRIMSYIAVTDCDNSRHDEATPRLSAKSRFARVEPARTARAFLLCLLSGIERTNCWWLAEHTGHGGPQAMQRLLRGTVWDADALRGDVRDLVVEALDTPTQC
jgi:hypothetical protein